ncbi:MAG TPA: hypothetical protein VFM79_10365 [Pelobium sp.]|nr:hypothetical protein [Pelobium sp.]
MTILFACKKDTTVNYPPATTPPPVVDPPASDVEGMVTFDSYANGAYNLDDIKKDFFPVVTSWKTGYTSIVDKTLKVKVPAGSVSNGFYPQFDVVDGTSYELTYDIKFVKDFDWRDGGKLGFGFGIGDVIAGGDPTGGNGGSVRIMWNKTSSGQVIFKPYLYYTNMGQKYGTNVVSTAFYPKNGVSLKDDTWYTVKMRVKSNTDFNANGTIQVKINGLEILNNDKINWGDNAGGKTKGWVKTVMFQTFRGGQGPQWESSVENSIFYDNIKITKDPTGEF